MFQNSTCVFLSVASIAFCGPAIADQIACPTDEAYTPQQINACCNDNTLDVDDHIQGCCNIENFQVIRNLPADVSSSSDADANASPPPPHLPKCCDQIHLGMASNASMCCTFYSQFKVLYPDSWFAKNPQQCAPFLCSSSAFSSAYPTLCNALHKKI